MKKLLLIGLLMLTGCNNPISSQIDKEGDETRAEIAAEMVVAKQEIETMINSRVGSTTAELDNKLNAIINYLNYMSIYR